MNCLNKYYQILKPNCNLRTVFIYISTPYIDETELMDYAHLRIIHFDVFGNLHRRSYTYINYTGAEFGLGHCLAQQQITTEIAHLA